MPPHVVSHTLRDSMAPTRAAFNCPRCGEALPTGTTRCDACGASISSAAPVSRPRAAHTPRQAVRGSSFAWLMLAVGLVVGGAVGYALRSGSAPGTGGGAPAGPADPMSGGGMGGGMGGAGGGMPTGGAMPAEVMELIQKYHAALAQNPDDIQAHVGLGNLFFDSGQWAKAAEHYAEALKRDAKNADVRVDMAIAFHNVGDDARARQELERVTKENPQHKNAWFNLGVVAGAAGDKATNIRAWEQYLKIDPNGERSAGVRDELARLKQAP